MVQIIKVYRKAVLNLFQGYIIKHVFAQCGEEAINSGGWRQCPPQNPYTLLASALCEMLLLVAPAQQPVRIVHVVVNGSGAGGGGVGEASEDAASDTAGAAADGEAPEKSDAATEKNGGGVDSSADSSKVGR